MHLVCMTHADRTPNPIAEAMETLGLNQPRLAEALGVDQGTVSKWINGKSRPSGPVLKLLDLLVANHLARVPEAAE
jgi:DNA-binding transcriptional regulator YiaG